MNSENILKLFYKKKYIVECVITLDSIQYFNLATIQKGRRNSNSSINVRSKINSDELAKLIEKGKAIHLLISGDVILHKVFEKSKLEEVENPVHLFFPTESEINFGVQLTEFPELGKINLCLIRNGYLNQLNEFFLSHTIFVESCSLGPFGVYSSQVDPHSGHVDPSAAERDNLNSGILTPPFLQQLEGLFQ